jgi:hypothetical protein
MIKKITLLGIIFLFTLLFIYCTTDESTITGPFGNADRYISIANFSADKPFLYSNGDSTIVRIKVLDIAKTPVIGLIVNFSAQFGSITESGTTDSSGIALATFISDGNIGENIITADTGVKKDTLTLRIVHYQPVHNQPKYIELLSDSPMLLADGLSKVNIIAKVYDSENAVIPGAVFDFSTTMGSLSKTTNVRANQNGEAEIILTSAGSPVDTTIIVKAIVTADTSIFENLNIKFRGITNITYIDSAKMSDYGMYNAYIRTNLFETINGPNISNGTVLFSAPAGTGEMVDHTVAVDETGTAISVFKAEVLPTNQNNIIITSQLSSAPVLTDTVEFDIPGVEMLINTIDDNVMGDGQGWALAKATLREITGKAIAGAKIEWETTLGTIIGQSKTNSSGHSIDTLRIEHSVSSDTDVTVKAKYGGNVSISKVVTFVEPENSNRLILGFEPDISSDSSFVACDVETEFAVRDVGISALLVDANGNGIDSRLIYFSVVPNNFARICESAYTSNGIATVMLAYPPQNGGEIVRVWAESEESNGTRTRGSIDVVLPVVGEE